jgi:hypothetical protein
MSTLSEEEEEEGAYQKGSKKIDRDYQPDETDDDGSDSSEGWSEEEDEPSSNAEGASALLDVVEKEKRKNPPKNAGQKRKVPPIKVSDLAVKKQKTDPRPKRVPKKQTAKSAQVEQSAATSSSSTPAIRIKDQDQGEGEKGFDLSSITVVEKKKKETPVFNDKNLDYNLFSDDPDNVVSKKIKIAKNVILQCSMIDGNDKGKNAAFQDYAALSFLRKTKDEKAFEFNLPLGLAPNIIEALKLIINDNPKFFHKYKA